jgi:hypothetical protein
LVLYIFRGSDPEIRIQPFRRIRNLNRIQVGKTVQNCFVCQKSVPVPEIRNTVGNFAWNIDYPNLGVFKGASLTSGFLRAKVTGSTGFLAASLPTKETTGRQFSRASVWWVMCDIFLNCNIACNLHMFFTSEFFPPSVSIQADQQIFLLKRRLILNRNY